MAFDPNITQDANLASSGTTAYEQFAYFALRPALYFDACASIRPTRQSHRGSVVTFNIYNDIAPAITPLVENEDVASVVVTDSTVTVSLDEYGNTAMSSAQARAYSYLIVSEDIANVVGWNGGISFDSLARNPLVAGSNVVFGGNATSRVTIDATDLLTANDVRTVAARLANASVQPVMNGMYKAFISPLVAMDLREETGPGNWRDPHTYSQPNEIWNGELGAFESFSFIQTPRLSATNLTTGQGGPGGFENGGAGGTVDVFPTLFLGQQALAKTWSEMVSAPIPQIILGAVYDKLRRFVPVGWYWNGGYGRFREAALWRVESASTLGVNV
jgi:N4-gp56 family major capsid protein